jgi:hypothetical protein
VTSEPIAAVVADLRAGRYRVPAQLSDELAVLGDKAAAAEWPVVDSTAIYESVVDGSGREINLYQDHTIPPAWMEADICYVNTHGNVFVMATMAAERDRVGKGWSPDEEWTTEEPVEWAQCRWLLEAMVFVGGRSHTLGPQPTRGPLFVLRYAVDPDGQPLDLHWIDLMRKAKSDAGRMPGEWDAAMLTHLATLDFLACRNVELVDVVHPNRAAARRAARTGVVVKELSVRPVGRTSRGGGGAGSGAGVPLTSVHGHRAHYGDCCPGRHEPRGLAFGKLTGRFWIPQHARGDAKVGVHRNDYRLDP